MAKTLRTTAVVLAAAAVLAGCSDRDDVVTPQPQPAPATQEESGAPASAQTGAGSGAAAPAAPASDTPAMDTAAKAPVEITPDSTPDDVLQDVDAALQDIDSLE